MKSILASILCQNIVSMLWCVGSVIDHRGCQNVVRTSAIASCATSLIGLITFDVICDQLLNRRSSTWNLFVHYTTDVHSHKCCKFAESEYQIVLRHSLVKAHFFPTQFNLFCKQLFLSYATIRINIDD